MRRIHHDEPLDGIGTQRCVGPTEGAAPIVGDDGRPTTQRLDDGGDVGEGIRHGVVLDAIRSVRRSESPEIDGDGAISSAGAGAELVTPRPPVLRKAVQEEDGLPVLGTLLDDVDANAALLDETISHGGHRDRPLG
jgi:hypothetical protein